jgi:histidyl-tRNA synthetase
MIAQKQNELIFPIRWWSFGPFWRYERPQKGRTREFFQWNIDLIGAKSVAADAELIAIIANFFKRTGLSPSNVRIFVNNRQLMEKELVDLAFSSDQLNLAFKLIDRKDKMGLSDWEIYASELGLSANQINGLSKLLENIDLWKKSQALCELFPALVALDVEDYVEFSPNIIRGLDYYTGTVFEAQTTTGELKRSILGGGRYDNLLSDVGGDPLPAVGFAMGDLVITLVLENLGLIPESITSPPALILVTVFDSASELEALSFASRLRSANINVSCYPQADKLSRQLKYADRSGFRFVILLGPEEISTGRFTLKDLKSRTQYTIPIVEATSAISKLLESESSS